MRIEKVHIKGFRNYDDVVVELGEKTLVFGPNDSGKTNFLYALRILLDPSLSARDFELTASDFNCASNPDRVEITATLCDVHEDCLISAFGGKLADGKTVIGYTCGRDGDYTFLVGNEITDIEPVQSRPYIKHLALEYVNSARDAARFLKRSQAALLEAARNNRNENDVRDDDASIKGIQDSLESLNDGISGLHYIANALKSVNDEMVRMSALSEVAYCMVRHVPAVRNFLHARYTAVFIDEYQDCGLAQHMLFRELVGLGIRGVAFGDMDQAIFAYDGRSSAYLNELISDPRFMTFEITENHRCHRSIVDYSLKLLDAQASSRACRDKRVVLVKVSGDERSIARTIREHLDVISERYGVGYRNEFALLFASNKMLERYAGLLGLPSKTVISTKLDVGFSQSRIFFRELLGFLYSCDYVGDFLDRYFPVNQLPRVRFKANDLLQALRDAPDDSWSDFYDSFCSLEELCLGDVVDPEARIDLGEVLSDLDVLRGGFRPAREDEVNLLTYHKAKGLEFDVVFCLDCYKYIMPPYKYEAQDYDAYRQSLNMHYVGLTRARKVCYIPLAAWRHNAMGNTKQAIPSEFLQKPGLMNLRREVHWDAGNAEDDV